MDKMKDIASENFKLINILQSFSYSMSTNTSEYGSQWLAVWVPGYKYAI